MDRRKDRWESIYQLLTNVAGFSSEIIERVSAVDGAKLLLHEEESLPPSFLSSTSSAGCSCTTKVEKRWRTEVLDRLVSSKLLSPLGRRRLVTATREQIWGMDLTPGGVGCALSHLQVWKRILQLEGQRQVLAANESEGASALIPALFPKRVYLVVEDDAVCSPSFLSEYHQRVTVALSLDHHTWDRRNGGPGNSGRENQKGSECTFSSLPRPPLVPSLPHWVRNWDLLYVGGLDTGKECEGLSLSRLFFPHEKTTGYFSPSSSVSSVPTTTSTSAAPLSSPWDTFTSHRKLLSQISLVPAFHRTTTAYALSAAGAAQLLSVCFPLTFQLDTEMTRSAATGFSSMDAEQKDDREDIERQWSRWSNKEKEKGRWRWPEVPFVRTPPCLTLQPPLVSQRSEMDSDIQIAKPSASSK